MRKGEKQSGEEEERKMMGWQTESATRAQEKVITYFLPNAKDGADGDQAVNVGGAIKRIKGHHILAPRSTGDFNTLLILFGHHNPNLQGKA